MPGRFPVLRFVALVAGVAVLGAAVLAFGLPGPESLAQAIARAGAVGPLLAVLGSGALIVALVPRTLLAAAAGLLFGPLAGAGYVLAGAVIGATVAFAAGRWLGRDFVLARRRVAALNSWLTARGVLGVFTLRLLPIAPFGLVSYAFGTTSIRFRAYLLGTAAAAVPSTLVNANLGAAALNPGTVGFAVSVAAAVAMALTSTAGAALLDRRHRRLAGAAGAAGAAGGKTTGPHGPVCDMLGRWTIDSR